MEWVKKLPNWVKSVIGLVTLIVGFILLFQTNTYLSITVSVALALGGGVFLGLYLAFSKKDSAIIGAGRVYRYPHYHRWGFALIALVSVLLLVLLANRSTRSFAFTALNGNSTPVLLNVQIWDVAMDGDFYLEISRPGYETQATQVTWGHELTEDFFLQPLPVSIGIEEFAGDSNSIAGQLADFLASDPRFSITSPAALERIRAEIANDAAFLAENPMAQVASRSLGVDFIVSGSYEGP